MSPSSHAILDDAEIRDEATSKKYYDQAVKAEDAGDRYKAIEAYEAAYAADPDNANVCFRLAYNLDLVGEEDEALHLYEEAVRVQPAPLHALINLSIMYEDRGQYASAERCLRQVLVTDPNHPRARLYIKDVMASKAMVIDDEADAAIDKQNAILDTPVTDFDLSVRTRNALRKMNIRTLADLVRMTEAELRNFKNFGEASIEEIKGMLTQRGLRLGQVADEEQSAAKKAVYEQLKATTGGDDAVLNRSVNELNLSVRARKALTLLNVHALGDLCMRTEAELMGVKNFGMTSLMEIKAKLAEMGLSLRTLEA
jgi:DNA-directed RNA polymerase subunit alpha